MITEIAFTKMHGLGNDFVVIDARNQDFTLTSQQVRHVSDRNRGIGCDQLIKLETPKNKEADVFMRIYNADGSEVAACGNASRCVAAQLMAEKAKKVAVIETSERILNARDAENKLIAVDMGEVKLLWNEIPLSKKVDTLQIDFCVGPLTNPSAVNIGNPHVVFFVPEVESVPLEKFGSKIENHSLYPERTNVEIVQVLNHSKLRVRVWERGVGITSASGSCASAALVAAHRRGLAERKGEVILDGGSLFVEWKADNHVIQTGPYAEVFSGKVALGTFGLSDE